MVRYGPAAATSFEQARDVRRKAAVLGKPVGLDALLEA
jgi:hypothetical protein